MATAASRPCFFDMDGVLFDSMPNHAYSWSHAMTQFGLHITPEEAYMHEGRTGAGTIDILARRCWGREATEEEKQKIYKAKSDLFSQCPEAKKMPGAQELLEKVKAAACARIVVTGSGQLSLLDRLDHNFPDIFCRELMVTSFDVKYGKPNPEPYLMGLQKGHIEPREGIVVENAPLGVPGGLRSPVSSPSPSTRDLCPTKSCSMPVPTCYSRPCRHCATTGKTSSKLSDKRFCVKAYKKSEKNGTKRLEYGKMSLLCPCRLNNPLKKERI